MAEVVMGYAKRVFPGQRQNSLWDDKHISDSLDAAGFTHLDSDGGVDSPPEYSTDIGDAWEVVEKLTKTDYTLTLEGEHRAWWYANFDGGVQVGSAPLAICLAALKAVANT